MNFKFLCVSTGVLLAGFVVAIKAQEPNRKSDSKTQETKVVDISSGEQAKVHSGQLVVPENRSGNSKNVITIPYQILKSKSEQPGPAFFLLAGGPGSSGIEKFSQAGVFKLAKLLQQYGDVIAFDQRGTGNSQPQLFFRPTTKIDTQNLITLDVVFETWQKQASECKSHWEQKGIDLTAYNTDESAADIDDLRKALGYEKIILIGGSYGTHLGLHTIRKYPNSVERAIFSGLEGPDHTFDHPAEKLATLKRIAKHLEATEVFKSRLPEGGFLVALETVIDRLKEKPVEVEFNVDGNAVSVKIDARFVQLVADRNAGSRNDPEFWPELILSMYEGDFSQPARGMHGASRMLESMNPMKYMMDCASGISDARRQDFQSNPLAWKLMGNPTIDLSVLADVWDASDLGDDFRENVVADTHVLLLHGTWDTSTPIENARDVAKYLNNARLIEVIRGGHGALYDLLDHWEPMKDVLSDFVQGRDQDLPKQVSMPALRLAGQDAKSPDPQIRLWAAARSGDLKALKKSHADGADINALDTSASRSGRRALNYAALENNVDVIRFLLGNGADINAVNRTGFTPIHHAVENGQIDAAKLLVEAGADTTIKNNRGVSPIGTAKQMKHERLIQLLSNSKPETIRPCVLLGKAVNKPVASNNSFAHRYLCQIDKSTVTVGSGRVGFSLVCVD